VQINPIQNIPINISYNKVLARLGYAKGKTRADENIIRIIKDEIEKSKVLIMPKQALSSSKISFKNESEIYFNEGFFIKSEKIFSLLKKCSLAYGFAVTIGSHLEKKRDEYSKRKDNSRALILDAVGSVTAEEAANITNSQIKKEAEAKGLKITLRFSPGYGDWELSGQKDFLNWLGAENIGIKLTGNFQMLPEKSVSAILGVYSE
jgi:hypothetical protein